MDLRGLLYDDDPLVVGYARGERIQKRRLSGASATRDENVLFSCNRLREPNRRREKRRREPQRGVPVAQHLEHEWPLKLDKGEKRVVRLHGVGVQAPRADAGGG